MERRVGGLHLERVDPLGEIGRLSLLPPCPLVKLVLREGSAHGARLLGPKVQGLVLPPAVELAQVLSLVLVDDCQYTCDRLSHDFAVWEITGDTLVSCTDLRRGGLGVWERD